MQNLVQYVRFTIPSELLYGQYIPEAFMLL